MPSADRSLLPLCRLDSLEVGEARLVQLGIRSLLVYRADTDAAQVYLNRCPHLGIPLTWYDDLLWDPQHKHLQCLTHGALFLPQNGACVSGPCRGDALWCIASTIEGGDIVVDAAELPPPAIGEN